MSTTHSSARFPPTAPPAYDAIRWTSTTPNTNAGVNSGANSRQPRGSNPPSDTTPLLTRRASGSSNNQTARHIYIIFLVSIVFSIIFSIVCLGLLWMQEEGARVRERFYWADLKADQHCLRYGTRVYSARLANVPPQYDPVQACTETAIEINGQKIITPHQCEDRGSSGVFGHWTVNYSEPTCVTYFTGFADKGCISPGSGRRRFESRLWNLQSGDDWRDMCSTTPADFLQTHFDRPDICEHRGIYGVWGMWEFEDRHC